MNRRDFVNRLIVLPPAMAALPALHAQGTTPHPATKPSDEAYAAHGHPLDEPAGIIDSESVAAWKVDQVGYLPHAPKLAVFSAPEVGVSGGAAAAGQAFALYPEGSNHAAFRGMLSAPVSDADSGDRVQIADFSDFRHHGSFQIGLLPRSGDGRQAERSATFAIGPEIYERAFALTSRFFYGQRCGAGVNMAPEFPQYAHAICHLDAAFDPSSGKSGPLRNHGGWHDAGDYGRYSVNAAYSSAVLLWAWELFGDSVDRISLHLPAGDSRAPELLSEVRWNLDWMLTLQDEDGGVWHKQTSTVFAPFIMPEADTLKSVVIGTGASPYKSTCATADLAAVGAIAARVFARFDRAYAARCLRAAEHAWTWARKYPDVAFRNPPGVYTGEYGERDCADELLWAAAELWRTTGDDRYHAWFLSGYRQWSDRLAEIAPAGWGQTAPLALWTYALARSGDEPVVTAEGALMKSALKKNEAADEAIRDAALAQADALVARAQANGYRTTMLSRDYTWGSNGTVAAYGMQLLIADRFRPGPEYLHAALENLHYLLGRNALALSFVTHLGTNSFLRPHHRPSVADGLAAPWPGMLSGGPNGNRQDAAMRKYLPADLPPAKMYIDNHAAYSCNEVAINWNAPLVFLLAGVLARR
jgi:endoglucanase